MSEQRKQEIADRDKTIRKLRIIIAKGEGMKLKTINTPEEQTLSDKRAGAKTVRKGIQKEIERLKGSYTLNANVVFDEGAQEALRAIEKYIDTMLERDKKRKGGLWN